MIILSTLSRRGKPTALLLSMITWTLVTNSSYGSISSFPLSSILASKLAPLSIKKISSGEANVVEVTSGNEISGDDVIKDITKDKKGAICFVVRRPG